MGCVRCMYNHTNMKSAGSHQQAQVSATCPLSRVSACWASVSCDLRAAAASTASRSCILPCIVSPDTHTHYASSVPHDWVSASVQTRSSQGTHRPAQISLTCLLSRPFACSSLACCDLSMSTAFSASACCDLRMPMALSELWICK